MKRTEMYFVTLLIMLASLGLAAGVEAEANASIEEITVPVSGHIDASETQLLNFSIGSNLTSASFILVWSNADYDMDMTLIAPGGERVDPAADEMVAYNKNATMLYYIVPMPKLGEWTAEVAAVDAPETGMDYYAFMVPDEEEAIVSEGLDNLSMDNLSMDNLSAMDPDAEECEDCG